MGVLGGDDVELKLLNPVDNECPTPLDGTLRYGYVGIVKTLLGCPGVNLNLRDGDGCPLLSLAAEAGYEDVSRTKGENIDLNSVDGDR